MTPQARAVWASAVSVATEFERPAELLTGVFRGTNGFWIAEYRQREPGLRPRLLVLADQDGDPVPLHEIDL